jgi:hypothetical protein
MSFQDYSAGGGSYGSSSRGTGYQSAGWCSLQIIASRLRVLMGLCVCVCVCVCEDSPLTFSACDDFATTLLCLGRDGDSEYIRLSQSVTSNIYTINGNGI